MQKKTLEEMIEYLFTYITLVTPDKINRGNPWMNLPLSYWNGAEPFFREDGIPDGWGASESNLLSRGGDDRLFIKPEIIRPRDAFPFDSKIISTLHDGTGRFLSLKEEGFSLNRIRSVDLSELRGLKIVSPNVVELAIAWVKPEGTYEAYRSLYCHIKETQWMEIGNRGQSEAWVLPNGSGLPPHVAFNLTQRNNSKLADEESWEAIQLGMSIAFTRYYEWTVTLGYLGHPSLCFVTDPYGAMEVFKLRDVPEGKSRREALRNWIRNHWRRKRLNDPETSIEVRKHLRGKTTFIWNDLRCKIAVSQSDLKENEKLAIERNLKRRKHAT